MNTKWETINYQHTYITSIKNNNNDNKINNCLISDKKLLLIHTQFFLFLSTHYVHRL